MAESPLWSTFGKLSAVVTTFAAAVSIFVVLNHSNEELELVVHAHDYELSPDLVKGVETNLKAFSYSEVSTLVQDALPEELSFENQKRLIEAIEKHHEKSWGELNRSSWNRFSSVVHFSLENTGNKTATEINIDFPDRGLIAINHPDAGVSTQSFEGVINVPNLRANNQMHMIAWVDGNSDEYAFKKINVTYSGGVASVAWPLDATGLSRFFAKHPILGNFVLWLIFMVGMAVASSGKSNKKRNSQDEVQVDPADKDRESGA